MTERTNLIAEIEQHLRWQEEPQFEPCARCQGKGYHHGFGEHGADPDWCDVCGGPGEVPTAAGMIDPDALLRAALGRLREQEMADEVAEAKLAEARKEIERLDQRRRELETANSEIAEEVETLHEAREESERLTASVASLQDVIQRKDALAEQTAHALLSAERSLQEAHVEIERLRRSGAVESASQEKRVTVQMAGRIRDLEQSLQEAREENAKLREALKELHALVLGECPSLLNEDSGGDARLDLAVRAALSTPEAR